MLLKYKYFFVILVKSGFLFGVFFFLLPFFSLANEAIRSKKVN